MFVEDRHTTLALHYTRNACGLISEVMCIGTVTRSRDVRKVLLACVFLWTLRWVAPYAVIHMCAVMWQL